jgi:hypothetical protein
MSSKRNLIATTKDTPPEPSTQPPAYTGKTAALWFSDEDRAMLREWTVAAVQHDLRPSDSIIVRAALRLVSRDPRMIEQMRELAEQDGRRLRRNRPMD